MPIIKSAAKAARQAEKRTAHNREIKKSIKLAFKTFKANPTAENLSKAQSEYDKAAKKGLIKKNTASRRKATLAKIAKAAGVKPATKKVVKPATKTAKATKPTTKTTKPAATKKPAAKPTTTKKTTTTKKSAAKKSGSKATVAKKA